jgi:hypothetical protein
MTVYIEVPNILHVPLDSMDSHGRIGSTGESYHKYCIIRDVCAQH